MVLFFVRCLLVATAVGALGGLASPRLGLAAPERGVISGVPDGSQVAQVDLADLVDVHALPGLEQALGVTIVQFRHEHAGPYTTLTAGAVVAPGQALSDAIRDHMQAEGTWFADRITSLERIAARASGEERAAALRTLEDVRAAAADFAAHGAQVRSLVVFGSLEAITALRSKPNIRSVGVR